MRKWRRVTPSHPTARMPVPWKDEARRLARALEDGALAVDRDAIGEDPEGPPEDGARLEAGVRGDDQGAVRRTGLRRGLSHRLGRGRRRSGLVPRGGRQRSGAPGEERQRRHCFLQKPVGPPGRAPHGPGPPGHGGRPDATRAGVVQSTFSRRGPGRAGEVCEGAEAGGATAPTPPWSDIGPAAPTPGLPWSDIGPPGGASFPLRPHGTGPRGEPPVQWSDIGPVKVPGAPVVWTSDRSPAPCSALLLEASPGIDPTPEERLPPCQGAGLARGATAGRRGPARWPPSPRSSAGQVPRSPAGHLPRSVPPGRARRVGGGRSSHVSQEPEGLSNCRSALTVRRRLLLRDRRGRRALQDRQERPDGRLGIGGEEDAPDRRRP